MQKSNCRQDVYIQERQEALEVTRGRVDTSENLHMLVCKYESERAGRCLSSALQLLLVLANIVVQLFVFTFCALHHKLPLLLLQLLELPLQALQVKRTPAPQQPAG